MCEVKDTANLDEYKVTFSHAANIMIEKLQKEIERLREEVAKWKLSAEQHAELWKIEICDHDTTKSDLEAARKEAGDTNGMCAFYMSQIVGHKHKIDGLQAQLTLANERLAEAERILNIFWNSYETPRSTNSYQTKLQIAMRHLESYRNHPKGEGNE